MSLHCCLIWALPSQNPGLAEIAHTYGAAGYGDGQRRRALGGPPPVDASISKFWWIDSR